MEYANRPPGEAVSTVDSDLRYVDWSAIFAGAFLATALTIVLLSFGAAFGLSMASPMPGEGVSLRWITIASGIWLIWTAVSSFAAGGYLTGRLRRRLPYTNEDEVEARDGAHGVVVWAVGAVMGGFLAISGVTGTLSAIGNTAGATLEAADGQLAAATDYTSSTLLRGEASQGSDAAKAEVAAILLNGITAGKFAEGDRQYMTNVVAAETQLDAAAAEARVNTAIDEGLVARAQTIEAIDQTRLAGMIAAFVLAATMLVSGAAAYFAAVTGGSHRNANLGFRHYGHRNP
ncbi:hypothetical protein EOK75_02210 [Pseudorhodobacter turbinis]|uniref:Mll5186 protein n=1 Tax=Pseudorhodobacter turbinis TaxID=2500533 RepID=A0A4P8EDA3_9RHOB|nr:hypothetical protein [Pseudorhodobacter turbinis]QCO54708.1 hypothetical protein EOK75_02210 [Pseudorhodobacter turbinis]